MRLNEAFNKWIVTGEPFVIAKCGMSLDGYLTRPPGETRWLTSESSRTHAHQLRAFVDAIIVGAETIRRDNPRLTVRNGPRRTQPWRVILTKSGRLPQNATIFRDSDERAHGGLSKHDRCERCCEISAGAESPAF